MILKKLSKNEGAWIIVLAGLVLVNIFLFLFLRPIMSWSQGVFGGDKTWYAVHLANGQVYFGHLKSVEKETIDLNDVYYLEITETSSTVNTGGNFQQQPQNQTEYSLVHRGVANVYTTDNALFVNRASVLYWEKVSANSPIVKSLLSTESH